MEWILLYGALWTLTLLWSSVTARWRNRSNFWEKTWEGGMALFAFAAGMAAVAIETMVLKTNSPLLALVLLTVGVTVAIFPAMWLGDYIDDRTPFFTHTRASLHAKNSSAPLGVELPQEQDQLVHVVKTTEKLAVALAAVEKIHEQALLAEIAKHKHAYIVVEGFAQKLHVSAVEKITTADLLADVAINAHMYGPKKRAVEKLANPQLLAEVALHTHDFGVGHMAVNKINYQSLLTKIAKTAANSDIRISARSRLSDKSLLMESALHDAENSSKAVAVIADSAMLQQVALHGESPQARTAALKKLGGYVCAVCAETVLPEGEKPAPCVCPVCGAESHAFAYRSNLIDHRDYESGSRWEECTRCGTTRNHEEVLTL